MSTKTIFVTGFGPFFGHQERNASWEAVKLLPDTFHYGDYPYALRKLEIPVTYEAVDAVVPEIWHEQPALVIHVGVNGSINTLNLERGSHTTGYGFADFAKKCLPCDKITLRNDAAGDCKKLETTLKVESIAKKLRTVRCVCSKDAGNYLCGYIYLRSLDQCRDRTLFIHVPDIDRPYSSEQTKDAIYQVIGHCMRQLDANGKLGT